MSKQERKNSRKDEYLTHDVLKMVVYNLLATYSFIKRIHVTSLSIESVSHRSDSTARCAYITTSAREPFRVGICWKGTVKPLVHPRPKELHAFDR